MATRKQQEMRRRCLSKLVSDGMSVADVADVYDVSHLTVVNSCKQHGVTMPFVPRKRFKKKANVELFKRDMTIIADLQDCKLSYGNIGEKHNITAERVRQIRQEAVDGGVDMPARTELPKKNMIDVVCAECGKIEKMYKFNVGESHCCSKECRAKKTMRNNSYLCNWCGDIFVRHSSNYKKYFCSKSCWHKDLSKYGFRDHEMIPAMLDKRIQELKNN